MSADQPEKADARLRLFVALALPPAPVTALLDWREDALQRVAGLRPVTAEGLHVTLCFLGWQEPAAVEGIASACRSAVDARAGAEAGAGTEAGTGAGSPPLALGPPAWLPPRRPRVLAVGIEDPTGGLAAVQTRLAHALVDGGWYVPEARPFFAHVTVARARRGGWVRAAALEPPEEVSFSGEEVVLFRSRMESTGARYEALATARLTPS